MAKSTLTFEKPDTDTFRCLPLCIEAINRGGLSPTAVNGANEEAVRLFLEGKCRFLQIANFVEKALETVKNKKDFTLEDILNTPEIDQVKIVQDLAILEKKIFRSIQNGEKDYYKLYKAA